MNQKEAMQKATELLGPRAFVDVDKDDVDLGKQSNTYLIGVLDTTKFPPVPGVRYSGGSWKQAVDWMEKDVEARKLS
jgi:hypothetical protein